MMDIIWLILGGLFLLGGIAGSVLPIIPGPPIAFLGVVFAQLSNRIIIDNQWMWILGISAVVITIIDYVIPSYFTKRYGAHKLSTVLSLVGMIVGLLFFPPFGLIIGPFIGAFIGELMAGRIWKQGIKSAWATFIGFLFGTMLKLVYASYCIFVVISSS
jgi:uncharacterized protein YqgC (DUF456 family)